MIAKWLWKKFELVACPGPERNRLYGVSTSTFDNSQRIFEQSILLSSTSYLHRRHIFSFIKNERVVCLHSKKTPALRRRGGE